MAKSCFAWLWSTTGELNSDLNYVCGGAGVECACKKKTSNLHRREAGECVDRWLEEWIDGRKEASKDIKCKLYVSYNEITRCAPWNCVVIIITRSKLWCSFKGQTVKSYSPFTFSRLCQNWGSGACLCSLNWSSVSLIVFRWNIHKSPSSASSSNSSASTQMFFIHPIILWLKLLLLQL